MAKIWGVIYKKLGRRKALGLVEPGSDVIYVDTRIKDQELLATLIHEGTHILQPYLTEDAVIEIDEELSKMLWADGWRKVDTDESAPYQGG